MTPMVRKSLRLVNIPVTWFFLALVLLLMVPQYPYVMVFLYQVLGLYFVFQGVRENHDVYFSLLLPVRKRDIARSYMELAWIVEIAQVVACIPVILVRYQISPERNPVGVQANIALLGVGLVVFGVFNSVFFPMFLRTGSRLGVPVALASLAASLVGTAAEVGAHLGGAPGAALNATGSQHLGHQLAVLGAGAVFFVLVNAVALRVSATRFERADL